MSQMNALFKYADDTNLLVPENTYVELGDEFCHIRDWAVRNAMIIVNKFSIGFHSMCSLPVSLEGIEQVQSAKK